jgi:hypothetical protein
MPVKSTPRICKNCPTEFTPYRHWQEFCSGACRSQYYERYVRHGCAEALKFLDERAEPPEPTVPETKKIQEE